jgi:hypothetical protein
MATSETISYETVIEIVRRWPPVRRLSLVQDVQKTVAQEVEPPRSKKNTLEKALGLLATGQTAPSDAEIQQLLDEHRMEKYGGINRAQMAAVF